jgi:hypothetical protein
MIAIFGCGLEIIPRDSQHVSALLIVVRLPAVPQGGVQIHRCL